VESGGEGSGSPRDAKELRHECGSLPMEDQPQGMKTKGIVGPAMCFACKKNEDEIPPSSRKIRQNTYGIRRGT